MLFMTYGLVVYKLPVPAQRHQYTEFLLLFPIGKAKGMFDKKVIACLTLLFIVVLVQGQDQVQPGPPDKCFRGDYHLLDHYHKRIPSPEGNNFPECTSWQSSSCCTHALANDISRLELHQGLYNFMYQVEPCGSLSPECARYIKVFIFAIY